MKAMYFIVAILIMLGTASCSANENDLVSEEISVNALTSTFGATNLFIDSRQTENLHLNELQSITAAEVYTILDNIRNHQASQKDSQISEEQKGNKVLLTVEMSEMVSNKYTFGLLLNLTKYADGSLFYNGYKADCKSNSFKWHQKGFSFSCDNSQPGCYKFETQDYLYFKVIIEGSVQYLQVPFKVTGNYNPSNQGVGFTYNL